MHRMRIAPVVGGLLLSLGLAACGGSEVPPQEFVNSGVYAGGAQGQSSGPGGIGSNPVVPGAPVAGNPDPVTGQPIAPVDPAAPGGLRAVTLAGRAGARHHGRP